MALRLVLGQKQGEGHKEEVSLPSCSSNRHGNGESSHEWNKCPLSHHVCVCLMFTRGMVEEEGLRMIREKEKVH